MELIYITSAKYVSGYIPELTFSTSEVKLFDFTRLYDKGICTKLQDMEYFKNFKLDAFSVDWNNEIGFDPEFLYEQGIPA